MNMNYMNLSLAWMGALNMALALSGCTNGIETGLSAPEGIPVTVLAEISPVTKSGEAVSSDNSFDRTSFLSGDQIKNIMQVVQKYFLIKEEVEITMEANPGTLTKKNLSAYKDAGINRLSMGLQSADNSCLYLLGRIHTWEEFLKSYELARKAGFENINVDLMSALPGQDLHSWKTTLRKVLMLKPEHISAYSLIIEEGTPFYSRYGEGKNSCSCSQWDSQTIWTGRGLKGSPMSLWALPDLPDEETDREMYHITKELMAAHGYHRYEISNYARSGCECLHNKGYWTGTEYLGLGLGASSYTFFHRYHNTDDMEEYLSLDLSEAGAAVRDIQEISLEERMEEFMFLGLRMMEGVSGTDFFSRFGQNMWNVYGTVIERLEQQGLLEVEMPVIRLTEQGIDVSNRVLSQFLLD